MTKNLDHSWVKEIFTHDELKQYAEFEAHLKSNSTPEQKSAFEKNWANLVDEMNRNLNQDPTSAIGILLGKKCMDLLNTLYGKKNAHLRTKIFEKGYGEGKGLEEVGLTPEIVSWMEKSIDAYWRDRAYGILNQVGSDVTDETVSKLWKEMLDDMYGNDDSRKKIIYDIALADKKVSIKAKELLIILRNLL